jgi:hypothetical protein
MGRSGEPDLDFRGRYREVYGVDIASDSQFLLRTDSGDTTRSGQQTQVDRRTRDRQLLGVIEQQLTARHSVLVVFGGSHWSTLLSALEQRLGKPRVTPFIK